MQWYVYYHDINTQKIKLYNVFRHSSFEEDIKKIAKKYTDKTEFCEQLRRSAMYWFWSKAEWEVLIYPWCGGRDGIEIKIDVYDQIKANWEIFADYVWNNTRGKK